MGEEDREGGGMGVMGGLKTVAGAGKGGRGRAESFEVLGGRGS